MFSVVEVRDTLARLDRTSGLLDRQRDRNARPVLVTASRLARRTGCIGRRRPLVGCDRLPLDQPHQDRRTDLRSFCILTASRPPPAL